MDYISRLTNEELCVLCDLIPLKHFRDCFKMAPKNFNKLSKFRPEKVPLAEIKRIVVNRGNDPFISDLLNSSVQALLKEALIKSNFQKRCDFQDAKQRYLAMLLQ